MRLRKLRPYLDEPGRCRLVFLASTNRGYTLARLAPWMRVAFHIGQSLGHLMSYSLRGEPWINNLRIGWLHRRQIRNPPLPDVVQIVGDNDEIVDEDDSWDVLGGEDGVQVTIPRLRDGAFLNGQMARLPRTAPESDPEQPTLEDFVELVRAAFANTMEQVNAQVRSIGRGFRCTAAHPRRLSRP